MGPTSGFVVMAIQFAMVGPAFGTGQLMAQRLPRMSQELLRPATRADYLDGLMLGAWWKGRQLFGDSLLVPLIVIVLLVMGATTIVWARRAWFETELG